MATVTSPVAHDPLQGIPLFAGFGEAERADLRRLLQPRNFEAQRAVFWIGEAGDDFYIVEDGQVVICYPDDSGREVTLAVLGPGQFFGELSLLDGGRRTATARAQSGLRLLALSREQFKEFIRRHPSSAIHVLEVLGRRQRDNLDKLRGIKNANEAVEERQTAISRLAERVAAVFASGTFLVCSLIVFATWVVVQTLLYPQATARDPVRFPPVSFVDQPPTFFWLGFMVTVLSFLLTVFVLNSQKRQAQRDAIKADLDYQVNRKAQLEIMQLHEKLDRLQAMISSERGSDGDVGGVGAARGSGPGPGTPPSGSNGGRA